MRTPHFCTTGQRTLMIWFLPPHFKVHWPLQPHTNNNNIQQQKTEALQSQTPRSHPHAHTRTHANAHAQELSSRPSLRPRWLVASMAPIRSSVPVGRRMRTGQRHVGCCGLPVKAAMITNLLAPYSEYSCNIVHLRET